MRKAIEIDDELLERAVRLMGATDPTAVVHEALKALIARERARQLVGHGGMEPGMAVPRRRRLAASN